MTLDEVRPQMHVVWLQRVYGSPEVHRVAATVLRTGRLVTIEARDAKGERIVRRVAADRLEARG